MLRREEKMLSREVHGEHLISRPKTRWSFAPQNDTVRLKKKALHSSIVLQSLLYINVLVSAVYTFLQLFVSFWKVATRRLRAFLHQHTSPPYVFSYVASLQVVNYQAYRVNPVYAIDLGALFVWLVVEPIRLSNGFFGNLNEEVSKISTFMLLTIVPQMGALAFLNAHPLTMPFTLLCDWLLLALYATQLVFGYLTLRRLFARNKADFVFLVTTMNEE